MPLSGDRDDADLACNRLSTTALPGPVITTVPATLGVVSTRLVWAVLGDRLNKWNLNQPKMQTTHG